MDTTVDPRVDPAEPSGPLPAAHLNPPHPGAGLGVSGSYRLEFAATLADLEAAQRLRYEVFNEEMGEGLVESAFSGLDQDGFDEHCQHLVVRHEPSGRVVGTYRLQLASDAAARQEFGLYTATEFDLSAIPAEAVARGVELGRACVHAEHRHRKVLFLLWQGLIHYCVHHGRTAFFGCSSLTSEDPGDGLRFLRWLEEQGYLHPTYQVEPLPGLRCEAPPSALEAPAPRVPKLFGMYLRQGARILGPPALDREFKTIDFLTWVDLEQRHLDSWGFKGLALPS